MRNGKKIEVDAKTFEALQVILVDEWFACDHEERMKYYCGEAGVDFDDLNKSPLDDANVDKEYLAQARGLQAAADIVNKWLMKNWARHC